MRGLLIAGLLLQAPPSPAPRIEVTVFYDENGNGVREPSEEVVLPGVAVEVAGVKAETDRSGHIVFEDLPEGAQTPRIVEETLPPFFLPGVPKEMELPTSTRVEIPAVLPIGSNRPNTYLAFGDSITAGEGSRDGRGFEPRLEKMLREHFGRATVITDGVSGIATDRAIRRIKESLLRARPAYTIVLLGTNDWDDAQESKGLAAATVERLRSMIRRIRAAGSLPLIASVPPPNTGFDSRVPKERAAFLDQVNAQIEPMAQEESAVFIPLSRAFQAQPDPGKLFRDHLHPNDHGYDLIAEVIFRSIVDRRAATP